MKSFFIKSFPLVIIAVIIVGAYIAWSKNGDGGPGPGFVSGNGRLEATEINIATKLAGRVIEIKVDEGDFVKAGDVLAVMQTDVLEAQLNEARANLSKAKAAEISAQAQVNLKISDMNAKKAALAQRQSEFDQTQRRLKRSTALSGAGVITGQQFDDDETSQQAAKAAVDTADSQVGVAAAAVEAAKAEVEGSKAAIKAAEATVARIAADINDCKLVAPRDGRVQYRIAQPGEVLGAGGKVLNFVDLSDVFMTFFLPETDAGKLGIGSDARVVLDAFPEIPIPAKITFVASTAQFTPKSVETKSERQKLMFRVKAKIDPELLQRYLEMVKTGIPGVTWVMLDSESQWPDDLKVRIPE